MHKGMISTLFQTFPDSINTPKKGPIFHFNLLTAVDSDGGNDNSDYSDISNGNDEENEA